MNSPALGPGSFALGKPTVSIELRSSASVNPKPCCAMSRDVDMTTSPSHEVARPIASVDANGSAEIPYTSAPKPFEGAASAQLAGSARPSLASITDRPRRVTE